MDVHLKNEMFVEVKSSSRAQMTNEFAGTFDLELFHAMAQTIQEYCTWNKNVTAGLDWSGPLEMCIFKTKDRHYVM